MVSLSTQLKKTTWPRHQRAENSGIVKAMIQGTLPRERYVHLLGQRYMMLRRLEALLAEHVHSHPAMAVLTEPSRWIAPQMEADLRFFGVEPRSVKALEQTRAMLGFLDGLASNDLAALLGAFYVFEGSKNGARHIAKALRQAYDLAPGQGLRSLDPHGERQRPLWAQWKERLDAAPFTSDQRRAILQAACDTFDHIAAVDRALMPEAERVA